MMELRKDWKYVGDYFWPPSNGRGPGLDRLKQMLTITFESKFQHSNKFDKESETNETLFVLTRSYHLVLGRLWSRNDFRLKHLVCHG
jgi:hypothetical protein